MNEGSHLSFFVKNVYLSIMLRPHAIRTKRQKKQRNRRPFKMVASFL